jgi:hypothetical protein
MNADSSIQLSQLSSSNSPRAVTAEVRQVFAYHYPAGHARKVSGNFSYIRRLFGGKIPGYRACNTEYHNLAHTIDATLACARLVDGYNLTAAPLPERVVLNLLRAALLHDTGYIQEEWDREGTGAKYTAVHVERSVQFLEKNRAGLGVSKADLPAIANIIRCTGLSVDLDSIPFTVPEEKVAGCILGTADLLGQMSDRAYLEKLLFLYYEFKEAGIGGFDTEFDLIRKTIDFYEMTRKRMTDAYLNVSIYAQHHFKKRYGVDRNLYMECIERHIGYLEKIIEDDSTNFRHKLKRGEWVHTYAQRLNG